MDASFWHQRWERAEISFHRHAIHPHLERFWNRLQGCAGQRVFVPLCGKSLDMLWLAGEGHQVTGVEISPLAVAAFFEEHRLQPGRVAQGPFEVWEAGEVRILCGDFFDLQAQHIADCAAVYDRASLIALPPAMRLDYARQLSAILPPGSQTLLVTMEFDQTKRPGPPFAVTEEEVRRLYEPTAEVELLYVEDALEPDSPWRRQGLTWLEEKVYRILPR